MISLSANNGLVLDFTLVAQVILEYILGMLFQECFCEKIIEFFINICAIITMRCNYGLVLDLGVAVQGILTQDLGASSQEGCFEYFSLNFTLLHMLLSQ